MIQTVRKMVAKKRIGRVFCKEWKPYGGKMGCECAEVDKHGCYVREINLIKRDEKGKRDLSVGLNFQVADVRKPLLAVSRVVEKGNEVRFGPGKDGNYIRNLETGDKVVLRPNGRGSYKFDVKFPKGEKTAITVDSGAEESVCPMEWGKEFGLSRPDQRLNLINASGNNISHYGQRKVKVEALF